MVVIRWQVSKTDDATISQVRAALTWLIVVSVDTFYRDKHTMVGSILLNASKKANRGVAFTFSLYRSSSSLGSNSRLSVVDWASSALTGCETCTGAAAGAPV